MESLYRSWFKALEEDGPTMSSIATYRVSADHFFGYLSAHDLTLWSFRPSDVDAFILERYRAGNRQESAEHYIDCNRQFFNFHSLKLKGRAKLFSIYRVRKAYQRFRREGIAIVGRRSNSERPRLKVSSSEELKASHKRFHPRG